MTRHFLLNDARDNPSGYVADRLLVAMPSLQDGCFNRSVIYLCAHSPEGAMGVIVNSLITTVTMDEVLDQLSIPHELKMPDVPVHFGGPVEAHRGFILHSDDVVLDDSLVQGGGIALSANIGMLKRIAEGSGPKHALLSLGYSGWAPGQLEAEIEAGSWIVAPVSREIVFSTDNEMKWALAAASLGIEDVSRLSYTIGHA